MNVYQLLKKQNDELKQLAVNQLAAGNVSNIEGYRELVGFIRGLDRANMNISDLEQRMEQDIDE